MALTPEGLITCTMRFYFDGKYSHLTFRFIPPGGFTYQDLAQLNEYLGEWWEGPGIGPAPPSFWQYHAASLVQIAANILPVGSTLYTKIASILLKTVLGSASEPCVPQDSAPCFRLLTVGPFRRGNGRLYFPGLSSTFLTGDSRNLIEPTVIGDFTDTVGGLQAFLDDAYAPNPAPQWVVWLRRRQVGGPFAMPVTQPVYRVVLTSRQLCSQRLRMAGQRKYDVVPDIG